ncbi:hypothetical protein U9M48_016014 [Paspalum notatum var. saurae]|uniref:peroxidase n=1 Tax=Paspalum notatum var. saurae TaxID=547442 RepID=A0AAQ3WMI3_PASNO
MATTRRMLAALMIAAGLLAALVGPAASQQGSGGGGVLCMGGWVRPVLTQGRQACPGGMAPSPRILVRPAPSPSGAALRVGYYSSCPTAEAAVRKVVRDAIAKEPGMGAGLIRLFFHDCFVRGCDASVLLRNTSGSSADAEMFGAPNAESLRGFGVIDAAKAAVEAACPGVVSCADIVAFAARDASSALSGGRISFAMPAGRLDGRVSLASETTDSLPGPFSDLATLEAKFAAKGLSADDMVTLSGAHSVGHARCMFVDSTRPSFNATLAGELSRKCRGGGGNTTVNQDYKTPDVLDSQYYRNVRDNGELFDSDAALENSTETAGLVRTYAADRGSGWEAAFAAAMVKMGNIDVKTRPGAGAEIRKNSIGPQEASSCSSAVHRCRPHLLRFPTPTAAPPDPEEASLREDMHLRLGLSQMLKTIISHGEAQRCFDDLASAPRSKPKLNLNPTNLSSKCKPNEPIELDPPTYPSPSPSPSSSISIPPTYPPITSPSPSPRSPPSGLSVGYYDYSCPSAETIVREAVKTATDSNRGTGAGLIRLFFHDCFVQGCDASVLLNTTGSSDPTERTSAPNLSLRGFEVIDAAKAALEAACPGVVSCADIVAFAGRDATFFLSGNAVDFDMPAGRYDGRVSLDSEAAANLPPPFASLQQLKDMFAAKGLDADDMVTLSGAHTVGRSHCSSFSDRLPPNASDMNATLSARLTSQCSNDSNGSTTVPQDFVTPDDLDTQYYRNVLNHEVLFASDAALLASNQTADMVSANAFTPGLWETKFKAAMVKMGRVGIKTSTDGEIRKQCWMSYVPAGCYVGWFPFVGNLLCKLTQLLNASPKPAPTGYGLSLDYYNKTCPDAEYLVWEAVKNATDENRGIGAGLIRLLFHDAFVRGVDASVLLNTTASNNTDTERTGPPNVNSLRGFQVIDAAKAAVEAACPGVVSCADIVAFAARDASKILSDGNIDFAVPAGRLDGRESFANETNTLPGPDSSLDQLQTMFAAQGLSTADMVTLSGAHSIGRARCMFFTARLSAMDAEYAKNLSAACSGSPSNRVDQDPFTPNDLDNQYYKNIDKFVLFTSDAALNSTETIGQVTANAGDAAKWQNDFAAAMVKMGKIGVKTSASPGSDAVEIRKVCWKVNSN